MDAALRTIRILWGALFSSTLLYGVVLYVVRPPRVEPDPTLLLAFGVAALSSAGASIVLSTFLRRAALARTSPAIREEVDTSQVQYRDQVPKRRIFADPTAARRDAIRASQTPFIVGMALAESVALFGFVLGFLGYPPAIPIPFFAGCWILMLFHFPRVSSFERAIESAHRAKF